MDNKIPPSDSSYMYTGATPVQQEPNSQAPQIITLSEWLVPSSSLQHPPSYEESERQSQQGVSDERSSSLGQTDREKAFSAYIANIEKTPSIVEANFQDLQARFRLTKTPCTIILKDQRLDLCIKAPEVNSHLPIVQSSYTDTICLSTPLPNTLQKNLGITTILDLLEQTFPNLISSNNLELENVRKVVVAAAIPLNAEGKGNFFPQVKIHGQSGEIAYVAWDSSGLDIAQGFTRGKCDILLEGNKAFCGAVLSQGTLLEVEKTVGASANFMASKVTVMGILIPQARQSAFNTDFEREFLFSGDLVRSVATGRLIERGPSRSSSDDTTFGMLGVQGTRVPVTKGLLLDRSLHSWEEPILFCLEILPQFSSEETPVTEDDLKMAIDMQFQRMAFEQALNRC